MIEPSELRIGNFVTTEKTAYILVITEIEASHGDDKYWFSATAKFRDYQCNFPIIDAEPIPLTEEWLLKMGFQYNGNVLILKLKDVVFDEGNCIEYFKGKDYTEIKFGYYGNSHIKFVHQLQNLYYSLTGEELTINTANKLKSIMDPTNENYVKGENGEPDRFYLPGTKPKEESWDDIFDGNEFGMSVQDLINKLKENYHPPKRIKQ